MSDTENPGATTASSTPTEAAPNDPAETLATVAQLHDVQAQIVEVQAQVRQTHDLVVEHATAMGALHEELGKLVEAVSKDVAALTGRVSQLESRINDALLRLGVEKSPPAPAAPATPENPGEGMIFDGANWVPKPAAAEEPTS